MRLAISLLLAFATACATSKPGEEMVRVRDIHRQRFEAMVRQDYSALDRLLANDLVYTHSTGKVETKQQFIERIQSGGLRYRSIDDPEPLLRVYGDTAVVTGRAKAGVTMDGLDRDLDAMYTAVYRRAGGNQWRLVSWQATPVQP